MGWNRTDPMHERHTFIENYETGLYSVAELAERYGVSRKTAYKWINRYAAEGSAGLVERSRAPKTCRLRVQSNIIDLFIQLRLAHPTWGARKLRAFAARAYPDAGLPAPSTICAALAKQGLVLPRRTRRSRSSPREATPLLANDANDVWCIDFKGQFRLGNQCYCYPLRLTDAYSRFVLACNAQHNTGYEATQQHLCRVFAEYGLPAAIRSDNGTPFASRALCGISRLNVWWMKLGILHQRIMPAHPEQNGRHERMHRTLKAETTRPPAETMRGQQERFDRWRQQFNDERPHQGIGDVCPSSLYQVSDRVMPARLHPPEYPGHCEVRLVSSLGALRFKTHQIFLSEVLSGQYVALEEVDDGIWNVSFFNTVLGKLDERDYRIH